MLNKVQKYAYGWLVGAGVGGSVGLGVGCSVGIAVGNGVGFIVGGRLGLGVGRWVGNLLIGTRCTVQFNMYSLYSMY